MIRAMGAALCALRNVSRAAECGDERARANLIPPAAWATLPALVRVFDLFAGIFVQK